MASSPNAFFDGFGIDRFEYGEVLTVIYLKVSLSDFFTVFAARTNDFFWSRKPGKALLIAFIVATMCATFLSVYWFLNLSGNDNSNIPDMKPVSWKVAGFIWGFNLIFFMLQDVLKVLELKLFAKYYAMKGGKEGYTG
mmetsp:Transcript_24554/g.4080  ORF Transcript_24554/g.4080 Transcript_24554/m.4080 type:complete len:138 (+) Transcript_24554:2197-2610(+)|eukprot:CAMPEP_0168316298 /NCGR_PEP_ID=MMETSP0210-20121227/15155_1 /TAXON_ID=40633 /ORGANISM="Condylostoma magnum, Strain COL2" /LENGTH=137 /DNA_ID=CAMNT_0008296423 /DNA_START=1454 /DNA_END=1867 /DNA_ORIENTATION=-